MFQAHSFQLAIESPATLFQPLFAQRAAVAVVLVCVLAAALGPTIVLRDLPFFTHAIGAGAYPALVLAIAVGVSLSVAAVAGALVFAALLWMLTRGTGANADRRDAITGISVAAALGAGAVLASTVASGVLRLAAPPEALLFGSVLTVDDSTLLVTGAIAIAVAVTSWMLAGRWLAGGFDSGVSGLLGVARLDGALLFAVALAAAATLPVTGSLMAGSLLVVPAATARILTARAAAMAPLTFLIALGEGALGLYSSLAFDLPTGATIAGFAGIGFVVAAAALAMIRLARRGAVRAAVAPVASLILLGAVLSGCGSSTSGTTATGALKVVTTTTQTGDLVRQIGGNSVAVTSLLPPGVDPHTYEPKPSAVTALASAGEIFRSGGDVDNWLTPAVKAANAVHNPVDLSKATVLMFSAGASQPPNAHWYLSTENLASAAQRVRDELIKAEPSARETLRANTTAYLEALDRTTAALKACVAKLPAGDRAIVTGHDDFDYLAKQYGLKIAAQLASTGVSEPSVKDVQVAVDAARKGGAKAMVVSRGEVPQLAVEVAKKLKIPLLQLYADSLAKSGPASTAAGAIAYNLGQIVKATSNGAVNCPAARSG